MIELKKPSQLKLRRPKTLLEVSEKTLAGYPYNFAFKEFLDEFIKDPDLSRIQERPLSLCEKEPHKNDPLDGFVYDVHLAGAAEYLAFWLGKTSPEWSQLACYFLTEPVVFGGKHSKQLVVMETPFCFRRRLLFCGSAFQKLHKIKSDICK